MNNIDIAGIVEEVKKDLEVNKTCFYIVLIAIGITSVLGILTIPVGIAGYLGYKTYTGYIEKPINNDDLEIIDKVEPIDNDIYVDKDGSISKDT